MNNKIEIVVARYNEDLAWTNEFPFNKFNYTVYNKGNNENFEKKYVKKIINLNNVGKCDHTYLFHIVNNFNQLANITIFFPGSIEMDHKKKLAIRLLSNIVKHKKAIFLAYFTKSVYLQFKDFTLDSWSTSHEKNYSENKESKLLLSKIRPFGKWFRFWFGTREVPYYCHFGIFSVDKKDIIKNNINHYRKMLSLLSKHSNPEVGHYIERSWGVVFYPLMFTKVISHDDTKSPSVYKNDLVEGKLKFTNSNLIMGNYTK